MVVFTPLHHDIILKVRMLRIREVGKKNLPIPFKYTMFHCPSVLHEIVVAVVVFFAPFDYLDFIATFSFMNS